MSRTTVARYACNRIPHIVLQKRTTILGTEDNMDQQKAQRLGHDEDYKAPSISTALSLTMLTLCAIGCTSTPKPKPSPTPSATITATPTRPTTPPPPIKLFHQTADSITLTTTPDATDQQISAILWQLRDAAHNHTFDALHIPQKLIDARSPNIWFHLYRGPKCAPEKYAPGVPTLRPQLPRRRRLHPRQPPRPQLGQRRPPHPLHHRRPPRNPTLAPRLHLRRAPLASFSLHSILYALSSEVSCSTPS